MAALTLALSLVLAQDDPSRPPMPPMPRAVDSLTDRQGIRHEPKEGDEVVVLDTEKGRIVVMLLADYAPRHAANFLNLAGSKFYDGTRFHRCIEGFMVQGGDPNSRNLSAFGLWGTGGNGAEGAEKTVAAEFTKLKHLRGIVSMARSTHPDSASSQFFIVTSDSTFLDGAYSAFGKVVRGMAVADEIVKTGANDENGSVLPSIAVVITTASVQKWPLSKD